MSSDQVSALERSNRAAVPVPVTRVRPARAKLISTSRYPRDIAAPPLQSWSGPTPAEERCGLL